MAALAETAFHAQLSDSKSAVSDLQREIDRLTLQYHKTRDASYLAQATKLARKKELLMKPERMRPRKSA